MASPGRSRRRPLVGPTRRRRAARPRRRDADDGRGAGRSADRRRLGASQASWTAMVADDRLVDIETAVDDVEEDGLAGDEVQRRRAGTRSPGDQVDLAGRHRRPATIGGVGEGRAASHAARAATTRAPRRSARARTGADRAAGVEGHGAASLWRTVVAEERPGPRLDTPPAASHRSAHPAVPRERRGPVTSRGPGWRSPRSPTAQSRIHRPAFARDGASRRPAREASRSASGTSWRSTASTSTSATASSSRCSARPARARRPRSG